MSVEYIVPRKLLIEDGNMSRRLHNEQRALAENFRQFSFRQNSKGQLYVSGGLRTNAGRVYQIMIEIPPDYPHAYKAGNLCIMRPDQWRPIFSLAFVVAKVAIWLNKYDVYRKKGYWPGNEQQH